MITLLTAYLFLASSILAKKFVLQTFSPLLFVALRMLPAGLLLLTISNITNRTVKWRQVTSEHGVAFIFIALFTSLLPSLLKAYAIANMPASKAVLLSCTGPFITAFYTYLLWGERISKHKLAGILMGIAGVAVLISTHSTLEETLKMWAIFSLPELAGLGAVFASRYGWIMVQNKVKSGHYTPMEINGIVMTIAGVTAMILAWLSEPSMRCWSGGASSLTALLFTIVGGNVVGYTLYTKALKKHSVTFVSLCGFSLPILVTAGGVLLFGERITTRLIISAALLFMGIALFSTDRKGERVKNETPQPNS